jgi:O-antigen/teichoic acid export membrane protein
MSISKKLFIGGSSKALLTVCQILIGFFMMPFLVENLGDRWYGIWTVAGGLVAYFYFFDFGLVTAVQRYAAKYIHNEDHENTNITINTALVIYLGIMCVLLLVTVIVAYSAGWFIEDPEEVDLLSKVLLIIGVNMALGFPSKAFVGIISSKLRYELLSASNFLVLLINTGLTVYFLSNGYGIYALAIIAFFTSQLSTILFIAIAKYCYSPLKVNFKYFRISRVKVLASYSVWSFLSTVSTHIKFRMDALVVGYFLGASMVTHYFIAARLAEYFKTLITQATSTVMPVFTGYHVHKQYDQLREKLLFLTKINVTVAFFGAGMLALIGHHFIVVWMGHEYLDAYGVLVILLIAIAVEMALLPARNVLFAISKNKIYGIMDIVEALFNILLSITLVSSYGMEGVAIGTAIPLLIAKLIFVPIYTARCIELKLINFYRVLVVPGFYAIIYTIVFGLLASQYILDYSFFKILATGILACPFFLWFSYLIIFTKHERDTLVGMLPFLRMRVSRQA